MGAVTAMAATGAPVIGICNGFQVLCEAGLLPGALVANRDLAFICRPVHLRVETSRSALTTGAASGDVLRIPLNSYEGNYVASPETIRDLEAHDQILLRYCDASGNTSGDANPNGSIGNIAGVCNTAGNVAGLMPHPERAVEAVLGSTDGIGLLGSIPAFADLVTNRP